MRALSELEKEMRLRPDLPADALVEDLAERLGLDGEVQPPVDLALLASLQSIVDVHFPGVQQRLVARALDIFYEVRDVPGLKKKPSTSELIDWLKLLLHEDLPLDVLQSKDPSKAIPPLHGALLKNEQDVSLFEKLAFLSRREGR